jgi:hypothetical protein
MHRRFGTPMAFAFKRAWTVFAEIRPLSGTNPVPRTVPSS